MKLGQVQSVRTLLRITHLAHRKSYLFIICPKSHEKLTKSEIRSSYYLLQFDFIHPYLAPKYHFFSIFSLIYLYLPVHSLVIAHRSLCPEKLGSNPGQGSKGINFSGWHGLDMSITVTKRR